jgi:hypothetical protein
MYKRILFILILITFFSSMENNLVPDSFTGEAYFINYDNGFVATERLAISIAEIILKSIYGEEIIESRKPLTAVLHNDIWYVSGTLPGDEVVGGVPSIKLDKQTGCVLGYRFGE